MFKQAASSSEIRETIKQEMVCHFKSRFKFLNEINGVRPGSLTGLLGISGSGKSTILKTIIVDTVENAKALVWLSEENVNQFSLGLLNVDANYKKDNLLFIEEGSIDQDELEKIRTTRKAFEYIRERIIKSCAKVVFIDNLTTSLFYSNFKPEQQTSFMSVLNSFCQEYNIAIFYVLHTKKEISQSHTKLIEGEDVRGCSQPYLMAGYFFILQTMQVGNITHAFLMIKKHRYQAPKEKLFKLIYACGKYESDFACSFESMNEVFKTRNVLGKEDKKGGRRGQ